MSWKELITDPNGSLSHTKIWSNIGMFALTVAFTWTSIKTGVTPELIVAYGGVVVFGRATSKYLDNKSVSTGE
jgi:hypothetical protein